MDRARIKEIIYTPTVRCNLNCKHCGEEQLVEKKAEISCEKVYDELIFSHSIATKQLVCSGGEPFLNEEFTDFCLSLIKEAHWSIAITTNGFYTDRIVSLIERLGDERKNINFALSIDGLKDTHNSIRKNSHSFDHVCDTLKALCNYDVCTQINTVIQNDNVKELKKFKEFFSLLSKGKVKFEFIPVTLGQTGIDEISNFYKYNDEYITSIWPYISNPYLKLYCIKDNHTIIGKGSCRAGSDNVFIGADGKIFTCLTGAYYKNAQDKYVIGNLNESSLDEIWNSDYRRQVIKEQVMTCQGCDSYCEVIREVSIDKLFSSLSKKELAHYMNLESANIIFLTGWHNEEIDSKGNKFRWMSGLEATIMVKGFRKDENIELCFFNNSACPIVMSVFLQNQCIGLYNVVTSKKVLIQTLNNKFMRITIKVDRCWRPCDEFESSDIRMLGIGLYAYV